jgi:hypothetical protein
MHEIIDKRGPVRVVETTLTDGSYVYDVCLDDEKTNSRVVWHCTDEQHALDWADTLTTQPPFEICGI